MDIGPEFEMGPMEMDPGGFDMASDGIGPDLDLGPVEIDPSGFDVPVEPAYDFAPMDLEPEPEAFDIPVEPAYDFSPMELEPAEFDTLPVPDAPAFELDPVDIPPSDIEWTPDALGPPLDEKPIDLTPVDFMSLPETLEPVSPDVVPDLVIPDANLEPLPTDIPDISPGIAELPANYNVPDMTILPDTSETGPEKLDLIPQEDLVTIEPLPAMDIPDLAPIQTVPDRDGFNDNAQPVNLEPVHDRDAFSDIPSYSIEPFSFESLPNTYTPSDAVPADNDSLDIAPATDIPNFDDAPSPPAYPDFSPRSTDDSIPYSPEYEQFHSKEELPEIEPGFGPKPLWDEPPEPATPTDVAVQPVPADDGLEPKAVDYVPEQVEPEEQDIEPEALDFIPTGDTVLQPLDDPGTLDIRQVGEPDEAANFWRQQEGPNDCALYAQGTILDAFGQDFDIDKYKREGMEGGWYGPDSGTTVGNFGDLLEANGVEVRRYDSGATFQDMTAELEQGHGVLVAVDTGRIWDDEGGGHALVVTGIRVGPDGVPTEIICNDSGRPDGKAVAYSFEDFKASWQQYDNYMVATKNPVPSIR